ncbi:unnamed protein product [Clavelina lepadiformis]|uniref:DNA-directed RNA polymerase III subunit RPC9 n=1 Tax=Clavelina lepadiformis TaxID=159417 RepID=A0ABP0FTY7_CLALP
MEITKSTSAMLSNYEVLKVLNDYAAEQKENKRNDQNLSTITYETLKYLNETPAGLQNEEIIPEVVKALSSFGLTKAEKLQLINLRPTTAVEISLIVEESEERISENQIEEILRIISQLPALEEEEEEENEEEQQDPEELLPYRCPSCGSEKRFRSLIALRLHMSILHESVPAVVSHKRSEPVIQPWSKDGLQPDDQTNILDNWEKILDSTRSVEEMYDKYSMKIDNVLGKYDTEAKHLEGKLRLAQQIEELKKQKEQLHRIKSNWKTAHGISQLVKDTDEVIKRSIDPQTMTKIQTEKSTNNSNNKSAPDIQSKNEVVIAKHNPTDKLDLSVQLAAQYKALAITTEEKLNEKIKEEEHLRKYIEATALKEVKAKKKLSEFMENLLTRAEQAEHQLQLYQDNAGLSSTAKSNSVGSRLNNSRHKISRNDHKRNRSEQIPQSFLPHESQLNDSGIQLNSSGEQQSKKSGLGRRPSNDAYVNEILERPISGQVQRTGNQGLLDVKSLMPFSNVANKNSDMAADRRVALFCVFAQLRSIDLLRCGMVCREWRETARHPQLWSRIHFHDVRTDAKLFGLISKWSSDTCYFSLSNIQSPHKGQSLGTGRMFCA